MWPLDYFSDQSLIPKRQGSLGNVGIIDLYSQIFKPITTALRQVTMRGIACTGEEISQYKYCRHGWGQAYENNRNMKNGGGGVGV